jgi:hypothetical protein
MAFRSRALPAEFIRQNDEDGAWLEALPDLLEQLAARWSLSVGPHFPDIRLNYVAPVTHADSTACVLKVSRHGWICEERRRILRRRVTRPCPCAPARRLPSRRAGARTRHSLVAV